MEVDDGIVRKNMPPPGQGRQDDGSPDSGQSAMRPFSSRLSGDLTEKNVFRNEKLFLTLFGKNRIKEWRVLRQSAEPPPN
jgi:hypothetical protein